MTSSGLTTSAEALVRYYAFYAFPVFNILTVVFIHLTHSDRLEFLILIRTRTEVQVPFVLSNAYDVAFEYCLWKYLLFYILVNPPSTGGDV